MAWEKKSWIPLRLATSGTKNHGLTLALICSFQCASLSPFGVLGSHSYCKTCQRKHPNWWAEWTFSFFYENMSPEDIVF